MNSLFRSALLGTAAILWSLGAGASASQGSGGGGGDDPSDVVEAHDTTDTAADSAADAADSHGGDAPDVDVNDHDTDVADVSDHTDTDHADAPEEHDAADHDAPDATDHDAAEHETPEEHDVAEDHGGGGNDHDVADSLDSHGGSEVADNSDSHRGSDHESGSSGGSGDSGSSGGSGDSGSSGGSGDSGSSGGSGDSGSSGGSGDSGSSDGSGDSGSNSGSNSGSSGGSGDSGSHGGSGDSGSSGSSGSNSGSNNSGSSNSGSGDQNATGTVQHADVIDVDRDAAGNERVAGEALLAGAQSDVDAAVANGFTLIAQMQLASMDRIVARLRTPTNETVDQAIVALQTIAPNATVTANSIYRSTEATIVPRASAHRVRHPAVADLGIIDTGADSATVDASRVIATRSFSGAYTPRDHGTIVASLAADHGMRVRVADVFGASQDGSLVASADAISGALDWMVANHVAVINISIEGPQNAILGQLVQSAVRSGHIVVAAAGNGGPLAAPAFPAAYSGAVAVTAIDNTDHAYRRANRGDYVAFAARGVDVPVALGDRAMTVTGTSFSAPVVAAQIARELRQPSVQDAQHVLHRLETQAIDLGAPGRDPIYGWGAVRNN